jgi:hypothetical protein
MYRRDASDTVFAGYPADRISGRPDIRLIQKPETGYPANPKAGYRISGKGRIQDIRPDT